MIRDFFRKVSEVKTAKMGNEESTSNVEHSGDQHVEIVNVQAEHSARLDEHTNILWTIFAMVALAVQLGLTIYREVKHYLTRKAARAAEKLYKMRTMSSEQI